MLRLLFPILSQILFGAHLLFHGYGLLSLAVLIPIVLLAIPKRSVIFFETLCLVSYAFEWALSGWQLIALRLRYDMPWHTAALIMGSVSLFTLLSALSFRNQQVKDFYLK